MKPNFLILMVDQMAGPLLDKDMIGHLHAPNIKRLIEQGVQFNNCYTPSPLCTPSRGSFMTGQLPSRNGIYDNAAEFKSTTPSFAHYLRAMGYQTALAGKMHFVGADQLHGFEERTTTDIYPADFGWTPNWDKPHERIDWWYHNLSTVTGAGIAEISNQLEFDDEVAYTARLQLYKYARRIDTRPFCLCVSFTHPHDPYVARQKYWDLYEHELIPMPKVEDMGFEQQDPHSQRLYIASDYTNFDITREHIRKARHAYLANVSYLDEKIGDLLSTLDDCAFTENTHILLCADHGDMLGERGLWYKMNFFEYSARIPLVLKHPTSFSSTQVDTPVSNCDILPSLIELAGGNPLDVVAPIDGESFVGLARGEGQPQRRAISEYCAEGSAGPMIMIRDARYKFIFSTTEAAQLFDLSADPMELSNLADDPGHAEVMNGFMQELNARWDIQQFTADVLLSQRSRHLVDKANRQGRFQSWDYEPPTMASERFMRNHLDLNVLELNNRFPK